MSRIGKPALLAKVPYSTALLMAAASKAGPLETLQPQSWWMCRLSSFTLRLWKCAKGRPASSICLTIFHMHQAEACRSLESKPSGGTTVVTCDGGMFSNGKQSRSVPCSLHAQPLRLVIHITGSVAQPNPPRIVNAQPCPIALTIAPIAATPPAANRHRVILTDAEAITGRDGFMSTINVLQALKMPVTVNPMMTCMTSGTARCIRGCKVHP